MGATLKALIARRGLKVGTYVAEFATPGIGHLVRSAAGEFVLFGMEHSGFAMETTKTVLRYLEAANMPTIVHVPTQDYRDVARALDIGAEAIMTPMIATAAQAKAVLACMKYPPAGRRSKGTLPAYERLAMPTVEQHIAEANRCSVFVPLVENEEGVANVEEIALLNGVDAIWIGQLDLSISLGIPNQLEHPRFLAALDRVAAACRKADKPAAILAATPQQGADFFRRGYDFICFGGDAVLYRDALHDGVAALRAAVLHAQT
jgi:2-keto-3-deoxy-L-rhamnonate aldolase RhmA